MGSPNHHRAQERWLSDVQIRLRKTQKSALKQLHQLLDLYRDVDLTEECRMTLGEWMDKWLDEYMIFTIKENTIKGYRSQIDHQIKPFIGHKQLASLTTADIQKFYNKIKRKVECIRIPSTDTFSPTAW